MLEDTIPNWHRLEAAEQRRHIEERNTGRRIAKEAATKEAAAKKEAERQKKHDEACALLLQIREVTPRADELQVRKTSLVAQKDAADNECETACAPLREALQEIDQQLFACRVQGKVPPAHLHPKQNELLQKIAPHTDKLRSIVAKVDEELRPINDELEELRAITKKWLPMREQLLDNLPDHLAIPLCVARDALVWAEKRRDEAARQHEINPSAKAVAKLNAAEAALATAGSETHAATEAALTLE